MAIIRLSQPTQSRKSGVRTGRAERILQIANKNFRLTIVLLVMAVAAIAAAFQNQRMKVRAQQANQGKFAADDLRGRLAAERRGLRDYMNVTPRQDPDALATPSPSPNFTLGIAGDLFVPGDFDGDGKTDAAVWSSGTGVFTIRQSSTSTNTSITLGQSGDDASVIGNYDSDTSVDAAVYRAGATSGAFSSWIYHPSTGGPDVTVTCSAARDCGKNGDFPAPGDYDGDGKFDFMVQRSHGSSCLPDPNQGSNVPNADFLLSINGGSGTTVIPCIGRTTDVIVPGDYDGDGKTDIATLHPSAGQLQWVIRKSSTNTFVVINFGVSATDFPVQGDYDGDGKTDLGVWRPDANPGLSTFQTYSVVSGPGPIFKWGKSGDYPVANFNAH